MFNILDLINPVEVLIFFGITILFFLIFREIVTWYWKINKRVNLLQRIEWYLIKIEKNTRKTEEKKPQAEDENSEEKESNQDNPTT